MPSEIITFLFTDIEGSTRLWERFPDAMRRLLAVHDDLLRQAIAANEGRIFKTGGDSFSAAFGSAGAALRAALAAQRALQTAHGGEMGRLRVRMALHTGEVEARAGDYFGPPLNRAARLLDAAHGEQTLLSQAVYHLVCEDLPAPAELRDLGAHGLKDLVQPETVYQLCHPDLRTEFPPLRSLEAQPNNLPLQLTSFVGREAQVEEVRRLLGRARLLTLTGPGGCGKTRLALQVAADSIGKLAAGVWLADLAPRTAHPDSVWATVADALGVRAEHGHDGGVAPGRPVPRALLDFLRSREMLLVLDNCEHLLLPCGEFATRVLATCPRVRILATSREALGIAGETLWPVPSLSVPGPDAGSGAEAVQLFVERARAVQPGFTLSAEAAPAVARICRQLDGIPLAIELAAARLKVLSVEQIADRLSDRFRLLTGGDRTALPRQQTLRALIDWSWDLLSEGEKALLGRLSVFAGGWDLEAAEAVCAESCDVEGGVLEILSRLVDKSLVIAELVEVNTPGRGAHLSARYRLLETIRQYAAEKLEHSGGTAAVRTRHRDWYAGFAEAAEPDLRGPHQAAWFDRLEREHDNLRAALEWCRTTEDASTGLRLAGALSRFWYVRGYLGDGRAWLEAFLAAGQPAVPQALRAKALHAVGGLARDQGDAVAAERYYHEALELRRVMGDRPGAATSLLQQGAVALDRGEREHGLALLDESLAEFRKMGNLRGAAMALGYKAVAALDGGCTAAAADLLEESLGLSRAVGESWGAAQALTHLGHLALIGEDVAWAEELFREALALYQETGDRRGIGLALRSLGDAAAKRGDGAGARESYERSLELYRAAGDRRGTAHCLDGLAGVLRQQARFEQAALLYGAADRLWEDMRVAGSRRDPEKRRPGGPEDEPAAPSDGFRTARSRGRVLPLEQVLTAALADTSPPA